MEKTHIKGTDMCMSVCNLLQIDKGTGSLYSLSTILGDV